MGQVAQSQRAISLAQLLSCNAVFIVPKAHATEFLFDCDSQKAHISQSTPHMLREHVFFVHRLSERFNFLICEAFNHLTQVLSSLIKLQNVIKVRLGCEAAIHDLG